MTSPGEPSPKALAPLKDRRNECARIGGLLDRAARGSGGGLLLRGRPGSGKSALLSHAAGRATGFRVLWVTAARREAGFPLATLHTLCRLLGAEAEPEAERLARALSAARLATGPAAHMPLFTALRDALTAAARTAPFLLLLEDHQWADEESALALSYTARRLEGVRAAILAAGRPAPGAVPSRLPVLDVPPLSVDAARDLLHDLHGELCPDVRDRLAATAAGNPLALRELSAGLGVAELAGRLPLPDPLPATERLTEVFGDTLGGLPEATRLLLVAAAADGPIADLPAVLGAAPALGVCPADLSPAESAGLVRVDGRGIRFVDPVQRVVAYADGSTITRWRVHTALAGAHTGDPIQAARHFAAAATTAAEPVAHDLERAADDATRHGFPAPAMLALHRAAQLSPDPRARARRSVAAAAAALRSGRFHMVRGLLPAAGAGGVDRADGAAPGGRAFWGAGPGAVRSSGARSGAVQGSDATGSGATDSGAADDAATRALAYTVTLLAELQIAPSPTVEVDDLTEHLPHIPEQDADLRNSALFQLARLSSMSGDPVHRDRAHDWLRRHGGHRALCAAVAARQNPVGAAPEVRALLDSARGPEWKDASWNNRDAEVLTWLADAAWSIGDLDGCGHFLARALLRTGSDAGAGRLHCDLMRTALRIARGQWEGLEREVGRTIADADGAGRHRHAADLRTLLLLPLIHRGSFEQAGDVVTRLDAWGRLCDPRLRQDTARHPRGLLALLRRDFPEAHAQLSALHDTGRGTPHAIGVQTAFLDGVVAALGADDQEAARARLAWATEHRLDRTDGVITPAVHHAHALYSARYGGDEELTEGHFRAAFAHPRCADRPLEHARLCLDHGIWLRRRHRFGEARRALRKALGTFTRLGAGPWIERADSELRACGAPVPGTAGRSAAHGGDMAELTAHELRIARLAAQGMSNREIGERLHLSPRTVGSHLYRMFPRLGISSRRDLARVIGRRPDATPAHPDDAVDRDSA